MKRFITYVYVYENGVKGKNAGFIKAEIRDGKVRMEIQIRNLGRYQGRTQMYLMVQDQKKEEGIAIPLGEIDIRYGSGNACAELQEDGLAASNYNFSQVVGMWMRLDETHVLASCWVEDADQIVMCGHKEAASEDADYIVMCGRKETASEDVDRIHSDKNNMEINETTTLRKIDIKEIRNFPKQNWYLCNNSFLIHGFFNYHYLILKKVIDNEQTKYYLGVPGIYEKPERMMALLFGFPEFEAMNDDAEVSEVQDSTNPTGPFPSDHTVTAQSKNFGCWYCQLDM